MYIWIKSCPIHEQMRYISYAIYCRVSLFLLLLLLLFKEKCLWGYSLSYCLYISCMQMQPFPQKKAHTKSNPAIMHMLLNIY